MFRGKQILAAVLLCLLSVFGFSAEAYAGAQQSSSSHYGVSEVNFGSGGDVHVCSTTYCSKQSAGELTVGNTKSSTYQAQAGFNTNREELLEVSVTSGSIALGSLSTSATRSGTAAFSVRTYLASGYSVYISGHAPSTSNFGHTLAALSSPASSAVGTEQFGINLAANNTPAVGANPQQIPDSTFSFGAAASGYNTPDKYKFADGDIVAQSNKSSGQTNYTMSVIENISTNTAAGVYAGHIDVIAVPTF